MGARPLRWPRLTSRATAWVLALGLLGLLAIGLGLLVLLTQASEQLTDQQRHYDILVWVNTLVACALGLAIVAGFVRLLWRWRAGQFGARLLIKLAAIFALVGVVPGVLIYTVSYQFVSRSIESWFDVKVEGALVAGLNLGQSTLDALSDDLAQKTRVAAMQLAELPAAAAGVALERVREQLAASDAQLWSVQGQLLASAGQSRFQIHSDRPSQTLLRQLRADGLRTQIEGLEEGAAQPARMVVWVSVPQLSLNLNADPRVLLITQELPTALVNNALLVQSANSEYQERALARQGLQRMYIGTLTLSLFMAVLGAILLAVLLGNQLARPLLLLARGMQQVADGDLTPKLALQGRDELDGLTRSFAQMTRQLADAQLAAARSLQQLEQARGQLQTILDNLTAGVMVLDAQGCIVSSNPGATRILRVPVAVYESQPLAMLPQLQDFAHKVQQAFEQLHGEHPVHELDHWQAALEIHPSGQGVEHSVVTLLARGALLPGGQRLLVFDDISEIVSAERAQAWGEVARRLAHEIKNPLTPIQLSAERLQRRLLGKVPEAEAAVLDKSVRTIVEQVDAMKRLVNEFRDYARLPAADLQPLDLNGLVGDVLALYPSDLPQAIAVDRQLDPLCPRILGDAQQLRQVVHNLLQNAQDACESTAQERAPRIVVRTEWQAARQRVRLVLQDSGPGFAPRILQRAFEPYVTTKSKGTGLGLAVVKKIADDHRARIDLSNVTEQGQILGAQVSLSFTPESVAGAA